MSEHKENQAELAEWFKNVGAEVEAEAKEANESIINKALEFEALKEDGKGE